MPELRIPDAAFDALAATIGRHDLSGPAGTETWLRAIAAPIVAAELRRLAKHLVETYSPDTPQIHSAMADVRARARELDPPAADTDTEPEEE